MYEIIEPSQAAPRYRASRFDPKSAVNVMADAGKIKDWGWNPIQETTPIALARTGCCTFWIRMVATRSASALRRERTTARSIENPANAPAESVKNLRCRFFATPGLDVRSGNRDISRNPATLSTILCCKRALPFPANVLQGIVPVQVWESVLRATPQWWS